MYGRITDKTELGLPTSGVLLDGRTVSNYHLLPDKTLLEEGWLPCEEVKPECKATEKLIVDTAEVIANKVVVTYVAVEDGEKALLDYLANRGKMTDADKVVLLEKILNI